jgi:hypothetical protein
VFGWRAGKQPPSLEDHFTQIDLAANSGHHLGPSYDPKRLRAVRRMTIHRIFTLLKSRGIRDAHVVELFQRMNDVFDIAFVTTNWDTEAESCLGMMGIPFNYGVDEITSNGRQPPGDGVRFLKLHGCADLGYCDCCRATIRFGEQLDAAVVNLGLLLEAEDFRLFAGGKPLADGLERDRTGAILRRCHGCGGRIGTRVGTFSYRKDLNPHAFYAIWDQAQTSLQLAERWLFVGYSLPEADIEIRHLLKSAQLARKEPASVSIEVVLKGDCEAGQRYQRFFGLRDDQIFHEGIDEWITKRLEGYCH